MSTISNLPLLSTATGNIIVAVIDKGEPEPRRLRQATLNQIGDFINREIVTYNIATATTTTLGGIIVGPGLNINEGVLGVANIVTTATTTTQGTIIVGDGLEIADGVLNVTSMGATGARGATGTRGATGATGPRLTAVISTSRPIVAAPGDLWLDIEYSGQLLTYNGSVWVSAGPGGAVGEEGPAGATGATGPQGISGTAAFMGATGATGVTGLQGATGPINPNTALTLIKTTTTNYTPTTGDHGYYIRMNNSSSATVTLVADSAENIPVGTTYIIGQCGTGTVTFSSGTGATIYSPLSLTIAGRWFKVSVFKVAANTWEVDGGIEA
jgi:hypothetical protein